MPSPPSKSAVARPASFGYDAAIGDLLVRLSVTPETRLEKSVAPPSAQRVNTADEAEEFVTAEPTFAVRDLSGGEGLFYAHRPTANDRDARRFWSSRGIDSSPTLPGEAAGLRLLKAGQYALGDSQLNYLVSLPDGTVLFDASTSQLGRVDDVLGVLPTTNASEDPHTGTAAISGLAVIGNLAYAGCTTDGAAVRSAAGTWSNLASAPTAGGGVMGLWTAKNRLFATITDGTVFVELHPTTGAPTTLLTLPSGATVTDVADAGSAILVAATDGVIYAFVVEDDGTLLQAGQTKLGANEYASTIAAGYGVVVIGTAQRTDEGGYFGRVYVATLAVDTLRDIQLYRTFDQSDPTADRAPRAAMTYRDWVYLAVPDAEDYQAVAYGSTVIWRYHLATGALTEHVRFSFAVEPNDMVVLDERIVIGLPGFGIYREADSYVESGWLISSAADFFTARHKEWTTLRVGGRGLTSGATATIHVSNDPDALLDPDHASWQPIVTLYSDEQWESIFGLPGVTSSRYAAVKISITAGGAQPPPSEEFNTTYLVTPIVSTVTLYASLLPDELILELPVNVSDRVERPNRQPITVPGLGKAIERELLGMQGTFQALEMYRYPLSLEGVIDNVATSTPGLGARGSGTLLAMVTFRGRIVDVGAGGALTGESSVGIGTLGLHTMGL